MASLYNRTRLWVNPGFQFRILIRMGFYLVGSSFVVFHVAFLFELLWQQISRAPRRSLIVTWFSSSSISSSFTAGRYSCPGFSSTCSNSRIG